MCNNECKSPPDAVLKFQSKRVRCFSLHQRWGPFFFLFFLLLFTCRPLLLTANYTNDFRILGRFSFLRLHNSCRNRHIWEGCKISKVNNTDFWRRFSSPSSVFTYITSTSRTKQSFCKDTLFEATHQDELALPHFHWQYIFRSSSTHCGS